MAFVSSYAVRVLLSFISRTAGDVGPYDAKRTVEKNLSREIQFKQFDKSKFETVIHKKMGFSERSIVGRGLAPAAKTFQNQRNGGTKAPPYGELSPR